MRKILPSVFVIASVAIAALSQDNNLPPEMASLLEAERTFAKTSVEKGVPVAFNMFFAEDAVNYKINPGARRSPSAKRPPVTLNWAPIYGDVSAAGDLGYNTGPSLLTDQGPQKRPPRHGVFFTIWKKQIDGAWKIVLDAGVKTPQAVADLNAPFQFARSPRFKPTVNIDPETERVNLIRLDQQLMDASKKSAGKALLKNLSAEARVHRTDMMPLVGKDAIRSYLSSKTITLSGEPMGSDVARSGDLGYTYGSCDVLDNSGGNVVTNKALYARVWRRGADGKWRVVLDTMELAPPAPAQVPR